MLFIGFGDNCVKWEMLGKKNCGPKRVEIDYEKMCDISLVKHKNLLSLSRALVICKTLLFKYVKEGVFALIFKHFKTTLER